MQPIFQFPVASTSETVEPLPSGPDSASRLGGLIEEGEAFDQLSAASASATPATDPLQGIFRIHAVLRRSLNTIVRVSAAPVPAEDRAALADFSLRFTRLLHVHHDGEEEIVFPKIVEGATRASLASYTTDVGGWREDHQHLLVHLSELEAASRELSNGGNDERLHQAASRLRDVMLPHLAAEEAALNAPSFKDVLTPEEIGEMTAAASEHGKRNGGPSVLVLVVHSLTDAEQQAHFGAMPWIVRKVLLKLWSRSFRASLKYTHNPSLAL